MQLGVVRLDGSVAQILLAADRQVVAYTVVFASLKACLLASPAHLFLSREGSRHRFLITNNATTYCVIAF